MAAPVVHFEIHANDPDRARAFYHDVFGWADNQVPGMEQGYWLLFPEGVPATDGAAPGTGINGGMLIRQGQPPTDGAAVNAFVCTIQVDDVNATQAAVVEHGGRIALPPFPVPGVGTVFYGKDTEGNLFGVLQPESGDPGASA